MDTTLKTHSIGFAVLLITAIAVVSTPATGETPRVSYGICKTIKEEHCVVDTRVQAIWILKRDLRGKKYAKSVARLIGRPICHRIINKVIFTPVGPQLRGWQMKLRDSRYALYSCEL